MLGTFWIAIILYSVFVKLFPIIELDITREGIMELDITREEIN
jgi:hypothetical protein